MVQGHGGSRWVARCARGEAVYLQGAPAGDASNDACRGSQLRLWAGTGGPCRKGALADWPGAAGG